MESIFEEVEFIQKKTGLVNLAMDLDRKNSVEQAVFLSDILKELKENQIQSLQLSKIKTKNVKNNCFFTVIGESFDPLSIQQQSEVLTAVSNNKSLTTLDLQRVLLSQLPDSLTILESILTTHPELTVLHLD